MTGRVAAARRRLAGYGRDRRGAAAAEFAILLPALIFTMLNITDIAFYAFQSMQVQNAAQLGAQAAWSNCSLASEFSSSCPAIGPYVSAAIQSTGLGANVTQVSPPPNGLPPEGYYCATTSGTLVLAATPPAAQPTSCAGVAGASDPSKPPGGYAIISVTYSFTPTFGGPLSVASLLPSPITATAWTRTSLSPPPVA